MIGRLGVLLLKPKKEWKVKFVSTPRPMLRGIIHTSSITQPVSVLRSQADPISLGSDVATLPDNNSVK